jgi:hypothetical protein
MTRKTVATLMKQVRSEIRCLDHYARLDEVKGGSDHETAVWSARMYRNARSRLYARLREVKARLKK